MLAQPVPELSGWIGSQVRKASIREGSVLQIAYQSFVGENHRNGIWD